MKFPERLERLPDYTFERLRTLLGPHEPGDEVIDMSVGAPRHPFPSFVGEEISASVRTFGKYPPNYGTSDLLEAISGWIEHRYNLKIDPTTRIISASGSREALFNACIALCRESKSGEQSRVLIPNPFYQVYAGAALAANAVPVYVNAIKETGFLPDYHSLGLDVLNKTAIAYLCSPSNPQGAVASRNYLEGLARLAEEHDFIVFSDECYSEIYRSEPPPGMLEAAESTCIQQDRVVVFNSLSKRSNLPGLRSGFAISGERTMRQLKRFRSYSEPSLPVPLQRAAARTWRDEEHVDSSRAMYREKYRLTDELMGEYAGYDPPQAGFFLWLKVDDGEEAALTLWRKFGVKTVPGEYFGANCATGNPGRKYIRAALVAEGEELRKGLECIRESVIDQGDVKDGVSD